MVGVFIGYIWKVCGMKVEGIGGIIFECYFMGYGWVERKEN